MAEVNYFDIIFGLAFTAVGGYLVGATKDDDPNRKLLKGGGIFFLIVGPILLAWELFKLMARRMDMSNNNGNTTVNPMYELPQNAVVEPSAEQPVVNVPNGTVIVNNPAPGNTGVGRRNNGRTN
jgi:hypothetical protein